MDISKLINGESNGDKIEHQATQSEEKNQKNSENEGENIVVAIRSRPLNQMEVMIAGTQIPWTINEGTGKIHYEPPQESDQLNSYLQKRNKSVSLPVSTSQSSQLPRHRSDLQQSPSHLALSKGILISSSTIQWETEFFHYAFQCQHVARTMFLNYGVSFLILNYCNVFQKQCKDQVEYNCQIGRRSSVLGNKSIPISKPMKIPTRDAARSAQFVFDSVFSMHTSTKAIYNKVARKIVKSSMNGFNGTIFAYGQTSSGKTFTMKGEGRRNPGIIPLAIHDVFSSIRETSNREFLLRVSYLEIYNEVINDLLEPENINLKIHEDRKKGIFVGNLKEEVVVSPEQVMSLIAAGEAHRHVGATDYNEQSSRSHTIFRMVIESKDITDSDPRVIVSTLNLIDLAGSERVSTEVGPEGIRRKEGGYINKSLLTLANVISKLSDKSQEGIHIPYRDSKLTRILQPSLSGNARIAIICTISLSQLNFEETNSTLKFATRAKKVKNKAKINEIVDDKALIKKYRTEIADLKKKLEEAQKLEHQLSELQNVKEQKEKVEEDNETLNRKLKQQQQTVEELTKKINEMTKLILNSSNLPLLEEDGPFSPRRNSSMNLAEKFDQVDSPEKSNLKAENIEMEQIIEELRRELRRRDETIRLLKDSIELIEQNATEMRVDAVQSLKKELIDKQKKDIQAQQVVTQQKEQNCEGYLQQIQELESKLLELDLDLQVTKADNKILLRQLEEKDHVLNEWMINAETWAARMEHLEEENQKLQARLHRQ